MPVLNQPITGSTNYILFPIIQQVSKRILHTLDLADEIGDKVYINTDWSTHSKTSLKDHRPNIGHQSLKIDASVQLNPTSQKWDTYTFTHTAGYGIGKTSYSDMALTYSDPDNRVTIHEQTTPVTIVLSCELFIQSKDLAFRTPQQIFNGFNNGDVITYQDLVYSYPIPKRILFILTQLWELDRELGRPAGIPFIDYVRKYTGGNWSILRNRDNDKAVSIVKNVYDLRCLSTLEYSDDKPQVQLKDKMPVAFGIPFVLTVQFAMPGQNIIHYPIMYMNQLLPESCIPVPRNMVHNRLIEQSNTRAVNGKLSTRMKDDGVWRAPAYDDWYIPASTFAKTSMIPIAILSLQLDEDSEYTTIDLNQEIDPEISFRAIMKEFWYQAEQDVFSNDVPYGMRLYRDDTELLPVDVTFTEDLILKFKPVSLRAHYRLVILVAGDIDSINWEKWGDWMMKNYKYLTSGLKDKLKNAIETQTGATVDEDGNLHWPAKFPGDRGIYGDVGDNLDMLKGAKYGNRRYFGVSKIQIRTGSAKRST